MRRLKTTRTQSGLTQEALAQAAGLTPRRYRDYENGDCPRSVAIAIKIAQTLGTTVEELFMADEYHGGEGQ